MKTAFLNIPEYQHDFLTAFVNEFYKTEIEKAIKEELLRLKLLGYEESEIDLVQRHSISDSTHMNFGISFNTQAASSYKSIYNTKTIELTSYSYTKALNTLGLRVENVGREIMKAQEENEAKEKTEKEARLAVAKAEKEAKEAKEKAEKEAKERLFLEWGKTNGSELLKTRIELGFDFKCLLTTEYVKNLFPTAEKLEDWKPDYEDNYGQITRPTLEQMKIVKALREDEKIKSAVINWRYSKKNIFFNIGVNLPNGETGDYVIPMA